MTLEYHQCEWTPLPPPRPHSFVVLRFSVCWMQAKEPKTSEAWRWD